MPSQNNTTDVTRFLAELEHPLKKEVETMRKMILGSHPDLKEHIKWNAPSYMLDGDDRITFNLSHKSILRLIFHCGTRKTTKKLSDKINDPDGLLDWPSPERAVLIVNDEADLKAKQAQILSIIKQWLILS